MNSLTDENGKEREILAGMAEVMRKSNPVYNPSLFWENLNKINFQQIYGTGYSSFKRTVNQNYFNFLVTNPVDNQFISLFLKWLKNPKLEVFGSKFKGESGLETPKNKLKLNKTQKFFYKLFVSMLWEYARMIDKENLLEKLEEPPEGDPLGIYYKGKLISQDLCNSVLEYYGIMSDIPFNERKKLTIAELGGGYGRCAFVFLKALKCKYVLFDIPPALYVAQRYLSAVFPELKIFKFRDFKEYPEIKTEYENADICFFAPSQMELLPKNQFDIFINISSFHEMRLEQIKHYFCLINDYCKKYFFTKQWLKWTNPADNLTISYKNYPSLPYWESVFFRKHPIQTKFFEALYKKKHLKYEKKHYPCA